MARHIDNSDQTTTGFAVLLGGAAWTGTKWAVLEVSAQEVLALRCLGWLGPEYQLAAPERRVFACGCWSVELEAWFGAAHR